MHLKIHLHLHCFAIVKLYSISYFGHFSIDKLPSEELLSLGISRIKTRLRIIRFAWILPKSIRWSHQWSKRVNHKNTSYWLYSLCLDGTNCINASWCCYRFRSSNRTNIKCWQLFRLRCENRKNTYMKCLKIWSLPFVDTFRYYCSKFLPGCNLFPSSW